MKVILFLSFFITVLFAEVAKVSAIVGDASIIREGNTIKIIIGTKLEKKDIIVTKSNSNLQIVFKDNTIITLGKNSALDINEYIYDTKNPKHSQTNLNFFKGAFKVITGNIGKINKEKFKLKTKSSTIGIRGTVIIANQSMVACTEGAITVTSLGKTVPINANQITFTKENEQPSDAQSISSDNLNALDVSIEPEEDSSSLSNEQSSNSTSTTTDDTNDSNEDKSEEQESANTQVNEEDSSIGISSDEPEDDNLFSSSSQSTSSTEDNTTDIVQDVTDDSSTIEDIVTTVNLKGKFLGGNLDTTGTSYSQKNESFEAKISNNLFSYDTTLEKSDGTSIDISASEDVGSFDDRGDGNYTSFSQNSTTIPFDYGNSLSGNYTVYTDNVGEVFVGFYNGTQTVNASTGVVEKDFNELFVTGIEGDTSSFDTSKIYIYKDFKDIKIQKDSTGIITNSSIDDGNGYVFYNPALNSLTHINKEFYDRGAQEFTFGTNVKATSYYNKYDFSYSTPYSINSITESKSVANINFLGTDLQAVNYDISVDTQNENFSTTPSTITDTTQESLGVSFLNDNTDDAKSSGSYTIDGYIKGTSYGDSYKQTAQSDNLSIEVNRDNGTITTNSDINLSFGTDSSVLKLNGEIASENAYYISDDLFGAIFEKGDTVYTQGTADYDLEDNKGYLIAVPDGGFDDTGAFKVFDSNDNPIMSDDESSWGYWTAGFSDGTDNIVIDPFSTWVAGTVTDTSVVQSLLDNATNTAYNFEGKVLGSVLLSSGIQESITIDDSNVANIVFNLGGGLNNMEGSTFRFNTDSSSWSLGLGSTSVSSSEFEGTFINGGTGTYQGKFYGTGSIKSVGGVFDVTNSSNDVANGVFKATKK